MESYMEVSHPDLCLSSMQKGSICMVVGNTCTKDIDFGETDTSIFEIRAKNRMNKCHGRQEGAVVSFLLVIKTKLCFRESARLVEIAKETGCVIRLAAGKRSGSSESIYSFARMGLVAGQSVVLTIEGDAREEAFHEVQKVLNGEGNE